MVGQGFADLLTNGFPEFFRADFTQFKLGKETFSPELACLFLYISKSCFTKSIQAIVKIQIY